MLNLTGPLTLQCPRARRGHALRQIARLVEAAERSRSRYATLAERAARAYAPLVLVLAAAALAWWGAATGDWRLATNIAAAVLIITCPCGLGLAVPAVLTAASGRLFRDGVLLKDGTALERLAEIDAVVFDKTGTLTTGRPVLTNAAAIPAADFAAAAALAAASAHPLARAIRVAAAEAGISPAAVADIAEHPGLGTEGRLGGRTVRLGRAEWVGAAGDAAVTTSWLRVGREPAVAFSFADELRPDAAATVAALRAAGLPVALLSGDAERPVAALAARLGIADWTAGATPQEKVARLDALSAEGRRVLMVGDGLNDAAALAAAHVSISPASAVDASRSAADLIILGDRLDRVGVELAARPHRPPPHPRELRLRLRLQRRHRAARRLRPGHAADRGDRHVGQLARRLPERAEARPVNILAILIPASLFLGLLGLAGFLWALRTNQYDDPKGDAARILSDRYDDHPADDDVR